ncbi:tail protein [Salmonella enterica subsp. enterica]|nr:tail protein [Salmonella enterica subsp. enterica]
MQDIPQETLSETTKAEQSAKVDLWEFDLTAIGGERFFFCNEPNEKRRAVNLAGEAVRTVPDTGTGF